MTKWIAPLAAAAIVLAPPAFSQSEKPGTGMSESKVTAESFVQQALQSGEKEVALAQLAASKSQNTEVKQFAQMVAADHERVNEQLRILAQRDGTGADRRATPPGTSKSQASPPPAAPGAAPSQSDEHKELSQLSGAAFDKAFMAKMVEGHEKSVDLYERATNSLPAGAPKKLAEDTLPKIKQHLEQAKSLQNEVDEKK